MSSPDGYTSKTDQHAENRQQPNDQKGVWRPAQRVLPGHKRSVEPIVLLVVSRWGADQRSPCLHWEPGPAKIVAVHPTLNQRF